MSHISAPQLPLHSFPLGSNYINQEADFLFSFCTVYVYVYIYIYIYIYIYALSASKLRFWHFVRVRNWSTVCKILSHYCFNITIVVVIIIIIIIIITISVLKFHYRKAKISHFLQNMRTVMKKRNIVFTQHGTLMPAVRNALFFH